MIMTWWLWLAVAIGFAILETLAPVFIFLGFAAGAGAVSLLLLLGITFGGNVAGLLVVFAAVSLVASIALRSMLGGKRDETKTFTEDIND